MLHYFISKKKCCSRTLLLIDMYASCTTQMVIKTRLVTCEMLLERQKKTFLYRIVSDDEKLTYYDNPNA
ncbi:hypothetical protein J437_LFUL003206 [Ladona fulva]|uniref:Uncharacterized protein n=1 Tax=Ladona fulva TaxID=123851 RepID=A0A8K0JY19_LADFU|nr:hypothetical protein J437_LFUL003206 [Ladona fulva]